MSKRTSTGGLMGLALAALCFAAALFLFQAHAVAGESALFLAEAATPR